eukprot:353303-Chlamydomonas_euryale.AAC.2
MGTKGRAQAPTTYIRPASYNVMPTISSRTLLIKRNLISKHICVIRARICNTRGFQAAYDAHGHPCELQHTNDRKVGRKGIPQCSLEPAQLPLIITCS